MLAVSPDAGLVIVTKPVKIFVPCYTGSEPRDMTHHVSLFIFLPFASSFPFKHQDRNANDFGSAVSGEETVPISLPLERHQPNPANTAPRN